MGNKESYKTREEILSAAALEFAAMGYEGARIQNIAEKVPYGSGVIYYHFQSKEFLYESAVKLIVNKNLKCSFPDFSETWSLNAVELLYTTLLYIIRFHLEVTSLQFYKMYTWELVQRNKLIFPLIEPYIERLQNLIQESISHQESSSTIPFTIFNLISFIVNYRLQKIVFEDADIYPKIYNSSHGLNVIEFCISHFMKSIGINLQEIVEDISDDVLTYIDTKIQDQLFIKNNLREV